MVHMNDQFMWGYQQHFRLGAELRIEQALGDIGLPAEITAVLVGFAQDSSLPHQICVEPESGPLSVSYLEGVRGRAEQIYRSDPDYHLRISDQRSHELRQAGIFLRSRSDAIEEAISTSGVFDGFTFFVSTSAPINGYDVHTCVGVRTELLEQLPSLSDSMFDRVYVGRSLHNEVIAECLRRADKEIYLPDPGTDLLNEDADLYLVTVAARRFVNGTSYRATRRPADLFDMVNEFSSMTYEREGAAGDLVISHLDTLRDHLQIRFREPVRLREARARAKTPSA